MLLTILQCTGQHPQQNIQPQMSQCQNREILLEATHP